MTLSTVDENLTPKVNAIAQIVGFSNCYPLTVLENQGIVVLPVCAAARDALDEHQIEYIDIGGILYVTIN